MKFDKYADAESFCRLSSDKADVYLGIGIWESKLPEIVDTKYYGYGEETNEIVKARAEKD